MRCSVVVAAIDGGDRRQLRARRIQAHLRACEDCGGVLAQRPASRAGRLAGLLPTFPVDGLAPRPARRRPVGRGRTGRHRRHGGGDGRPRGLACGRARRVRPEPRRPGGAGRQHSGHQLAPSPERRVRDPAPRSSPGPASCRSARRTRRRSPSPAQHPARRTRPRPWRRGRRPRRAPARRSRFRASLHRSRCRGSRFPGARSRCQVVRSTSRLHGLRVAVASGRRSAGDGARGSRFRRVVRSTGDGTGGPESLRSSFRRSSSRRSPSRTALTVPCRPLIRRSCAIPTGDGARRFRFLRSSRSARRASACAGGSRWGRAAQGSSGGRTGSRVVPGPTAGTSPPPSTRPSYDGRRIRHRRRGCRRNRQRHARHGGSPDPTWTPGVRIETTPGTRHLKARHGDPRLRDLHRRGLDRAALRRRRGRCRSWRAARGRGFGRRRCGGG